MVGECRQDAAKESVSLPQLRSEPTWENGSWHSGSRGFAGTEGVTGSNPVAPTTSALTRAFVDHRLPLVDRIRGEAGSSGRRALPCLTKVFTSAG